MNKLLSIVDAREVLEDVIPVVHADLPEQYAAIILQFSVTRLVVAVDPNDDSLQLLGSYPRHDSTSIVDVDGTMENGTAHADNLGMATY